MPLARLGLIYAGLPTSTASIERVWSACGYLQDHRHRLPRTTSSRNATQGGTSWRWLVTRRVKRTCPCSPTSATILRRLVRNRHNVREVGQKMFMFFHGCHPKFPFAVPTKQMCVGLSFSVCQSLDEMMIRAACEDRPFAYTYVWCGGCAGDGVKKLGSPCAMGGGHPGVNFLLRLPMPSFVVARGWVSFPHDAGCKS